MLNGQNGLWLADMGFMDFAGGTVVHSGGAWVGLAAITIVGARRGRFDEDGAPVKLNGHSPILATVGALIIWVGWVGFYGGSTTAGTADFAKIVQNTMISGGQAGVTAMFLGWFLSGHLTPLAAINGALAGLVAITPGCDVLDGQGSMSLGIMVGLLVTFSEFVFEKLRLDDPLGAVSVYGVCGAVGTVMRAVLAPESVMLADNRSEQIGVQLIGVATVLVWSFGVAFAVLWIASKAFSPGGGHSCFRVPEDHQVVGLNMAELINKIMGGLPSAMTEMENSVAAAAVGNFAYRIDLSQFSGASKRLCLGMNQINEICETGLRTIQARLDQMADGDLATEISGEMQDSSARREVR